LDRGQRLRLWQKTGSGYPYLKIGACRIAAGRTRAVQTLSFVEAPGDEKEFKVHFARKGDTWTPVSAEF
ncbi:MAG: hypothetical protein D6806_15560, partial [Deltaproteobacteria bacterium]